MDERTTFMECLCVQRYNEWSEGCRQGHHWNRQWNAMKLFFAHEKNRQKKQTYFILILQALLLVANQADPFNEQFTRLLELSFPALSSHP